MTEGPRVAAAWEPALLRARLDDLDPLLSAVVDGEYERQRRSINLMAPSMLFPAAVGQMLASPFANLDGEEYPGRWQEFPFDDIQRAVDHYSDSEPTRYNPAGPYATLIELLAQRRIAEMLTSGTTIPAETVFVNVQPLSGSLANIAVLRGLIDPGDPVVSLDLASGGHLSHGAQFHLSGQLYDFHFAPPFTTSGAFDLSTFGETIHRVRPKMVIVGSSSYPRRIPWQGIRRAVDDASSRPLLVADIAHFVGLVAAGLYDNPLPHADVTTFVPYKSLAGPRLGVIVTRQRNLAKKLDRAVFPGLQSASNLSTIAGLAFSAGFAQTPAFTDLMTRSVANAQRLANELEALGLRIAFGGTDTHMVLVETGRPTWSMAKRMERHGLLLNSNMLPTDTSPKSASGLRIGLITLTARGLGTDGVVSLAALLSEAIRALGDLREHGNFDDLDGSVHRFVDEHLSANI